MGNVQWTGPAMSSSNADKNLLKDKAKRAGISTAGPRGTIFLNQMTSAVGDPKNVGVRHGALGSTPIHEAAAKLGIEVPGRSRGAFHGGAGFARR